MYLKQTKNTGSIKVEYTHQEIIDNNLTEEYSIPSPLKESLFDSCSILGVEGDLLSFYVAPSSMALTLFVDSSTVKIPTHWCIKYNTTTEEMRVKFYTSELEQFANIIDIDTVGVGWYEGGNYTLYYSDFPNALWENNFTSKTYTKDGVFVGSSDYEYLGNVPD
jgi:hypothetical protein